MQTLSELYRYGMGPSSSHTMGPRRAAELFREKNPGAHRVEVLLYGSLSLTGRGHLTDKAVEGGLSPLPCRIIWSEESLPFHPNGMKFQALDAEGNKTAEWTVYSIGGGELREEGRLDSETGDLYTQHTMAEILAWTASRGKPMWALVEETEGPLIWRHLEFCWGKMKEAISAGLDSEGDLPGPLHLQRKAGSILAQAGRLRKAEKRTGLLAAYALAVAETNAAGGFVVTAPTCGSCGVLPAVLQYLLKQQGIKIERIFKALATAGLVGNLVKRNASISGAEVGCQGEVGVACAMAAAAAAQMMGGTPHQIEYAAEIGLEHHLGLTCDPVMGLVQIPCIERNVFAAISALASAEYALLTDGRHLVSFDQVVEAMKQTGHDLPSLYRETARGGLARVYRREAS
ncbi:MAG: L-serine ammonia-lyase [Desulfatiglandaceae bacterium]